MKRARITWRTPDGKTGMYEDPLGQGSLPDEDGVVSWYLWDEGNYDCDCNRSLLFLGLPYEDNWSCGNTIEITHREVIP